MKYFLIAGEPSGDIHGASLMKEISIEDCESEFMYCGGDQMAEQGGTLIKHYREMAYMGIIPVLLNIRQIQMNFRECKERIKVFKPDVLILIDYPGFNLKMAEFAKKQGIKTVYYISPKIWAWNTGRVKKIKAYIDEMYTIFPFETSFYEKYGYKVNYVGNPVSDLIRKELEKEVNFDKFCSDNDLEKKPIIALLSGSRKNEITSILPILEDLPEQFTEYQFVIAGAPGNSPEFYKSVMKTNLKVIFNQTYDLIRNSRAAVVASGTATLETALLSTPQVVGYKMGMGWFLEIFRNQILKTKYFSLVNLVAEKEVVKELFQSQLTIEHISLELNRILSDNNERKLMLENYTKISEKLTSRGAAKNAAIQIVGSLKKQLS